jgi:hypothetical protein
MVVAILIHVEAGGFLAVEGAAAFPLAAGARQSHTTADDRREGSPETEFVEEGSWKRH